MDVGQGVGDFDGICQLVVDLEVVDVEGHEQQPQYCTGTFWSGSYISVLRVGILSGSMVFARYFSSE